MRNLNQIATDIIKYLREGGTAASATIKQFNKERKALLLEVNKMILAKESRSAIELYIRKSSTVIRDAVQISAIVAVVGIGIKETKAIQKSVSAITGKKAKRVNLSTAAVTKILKKPMQTQNYSVEDAFKAIGINLSRDTVNTVRRSFQSGKTTSEVSAIFLKQSNAIDVNKASRHIDTIVRTSASQVANETRLATYRANSDTIDRVLYVSILDDSTTGFCAVHDGRVYDLDDTKMPTLPAHFNCRSTYVPIKIGESTQDAVDELNREYDNYGDWLESQTPEEQVNILGTKAYNEFTRTGKLSKALNVTIV